jgi:amino acid permease
MASVEPAAALAIEGGDPRLPHYDDVVDISEHFRETEDDSVTFEEYMFYAAMTRAEEKIADEEFRRIRGPRSFKSTIKGRFSKGLLEQAPPAQEASEKVVPNEKASDGPADDSSPSATNSLDRYGVSQAEYKTASRALRTASWSSIFFLITTDILGPFTTPWAFAQMGYGPGVALYTVFGVLSVYSGWILWRVFLSLDSDKFPLKNYATAFYRIFGRWSMHFVNVGQALQLLLTVSVLILSSGQAISLMSQGADHTTNGLCFIVCLLVFMLAGFIVGQIRTLQRFSWLANFSIWINVLTIFCLLVLEATSPPNFAVVEATFGPDFGPGPIKTYAGTPPAGMASGGVGFVASLNGLNQAVYSYGGAMLFISFLSEMRNPMDFWKGLVIAEAFIYFCYMFFGIFVYSYQGQFTYNPIVQGISNFKWQTALNTLQLFTGLVAAALYGNVGLKVAYVEVGEKLLGAPGLHTTAGKFWWAGTIPMYWAIAFIVAAAIPQFSYVSGLVGAVFILSFTYTFPAWLALGYWIRKDAMDPELERFDPSTRTYNYIDTGVARYWRGFKKRPFFNLFNIIYFLGALATTGLGTYSAVEGLIAAFQSGRATSFTCKSPV